MPLTFQIATTFPGLAREWIAWCAIAWVLCGSAKAGAADWPAWRYDSGRTAASPAHLPESLSLLWSLDLGPRKTVWDDPLNQDLMRYDRVFEPIVVGSTLMVGFNDKDKLVAYDTNTGSERWRFYASAPVRMPPVAGEGRVYFVSDDGWLYCLRIEDGALLWKYRGGPSDRKILGNERLISSWPARGAPVLRDGTVYFAASIWPMMGTFIYALNAETGKVEWINDGTGAHYIHQPHDYPAFAGIAPQGNLVATANELLVPGGRSVPACFDRHTGRYRYFHLAKYGKYGGSWVFAKGQRFFSHVRGGEYLLFDTGTGHDAKVRVPQPVLTDEAFYASGFSVAKSNWSTPSETSWTIEVDATGDLIKVGDRLYAAGKGSITAIEEADDGNPKVKWQQRLDGEFERLLAADDKLFAVTLDGRMMAFGDEPSPRALPEVEPTQLRADGEAKRRAAAMIDRAGVREGYSLFYGVGDGKLLEALLLESQLHVVAVDPDAEKVERLRRRLDAAGLYGGRIALLVGDIHSTHTPQYMSSLTVLHDALAVGFDGSAQSIERLFESLRPYGGIAFLNKDLAESIEHAVQKANLQQADVHRDSEFLTLSRPGALPGAGQWTHQYGNSANTIKSDDRRVKLPLGVLWFGGSSNMDVLPRHGHGPPEQIVGGRLFIEGMDCLSARDVYTGRVLWKTTLEGLDNFGTYFDETYENLPLTLEYNQVHIPGANARGTNFVATLDRVYVVEGNHCRVLDAVTGETLQSISIQDSERKEAAKTWGYLAVHGTSLIGGANFTKLSNKLGLPHQKNPKDSKSKWRFADFDKAASDEIVVMDRYTGDEKWRIASRHGFLHNAIAIADGKLFCLDKLPNNVEKRLARRGQEVPEGSYELRSFDLTTGELVWSTNENVFGSWLSYSAEHDLLLQSTRPSSDTVRDEEGSRLIAYQADDGRVVWNKQVSYNTPPILHNDDIIVGGKRYSLLTGESRYRIDPLTGTKRPWSYVSTKGCNYPVAAENLLTFRSSAAAFYDLSNDGGTGHFGGFKSGCTSNLIAADGVLNAPEYTRTCRCSFQNQTSLALVHMPDLEIWTHTNILYERDRVIRAGINFAAPGDRRSDSGTLWMDFPSVGGPSPDLAVDVEGEFTQFRHHASRASGEGIPWVGASGLEGVSSVTLHLAGGAGKFEGSRGIAQGADDAVESSSGSVALGGHKLKLGGEEGSQPVVGLRFCDLPIPRGAAIKNAAVQFTVEDDSDDPTELQIWGEASDHAEIFQSKDKNVSSRANTTQAVSWKPAPWPVEGESGPPHRTPELAPIIEEIVNRPGWKPGNALALVIRGQGTRVAKSFDESKNQAPSLHVEFDLPAEAANQIVTMESRVPKRSYTVRLYFMEPHAEVRPGDRVFDLALQGESVHRNLDIVAEAWGAHRTMVKEFTGVKVADELTITCTPHTDHGPILCGVEVEAE